jgi:hypothetical protein
MKLGRVNTGTAVHILTEQDLNKTGKTSYGLYCGSSANFRARRLSKVNLEVNEQNITCKKCLKAFKEGKAHEYQELLNTLSKPEEKEMTLKEYKEKGISFIIQK